MNAIEDRIRSAVRAYVPDDSAPPLRLTTQRAPSAKPARWRGWAVPLAAAAAVVAVVAASLVIAGSGRPGTSPTAPGQHGSVPPYYVASWISNGSGAGQHGIVQIRATTTGALEANVPLPHPYAYVPGVMAVSANARVFLLIAIDPTDGGQGFFLLRFTPGVPGHEVQLTPITLHLANGDLFALSPSGTMLAATSSPTHGHPGTLTVRNLLTGAQRTWTGWSPPGHAAFSDLTWTADGRWLQFCWGFGAVAQVRFGRLDPSAPGSALPAPRASVTPPAGTWGLQLLTDGNLAVNVLRRGHWLTEILSPHGGAPIVIPLPGHGKSYKTRLTPAWLSDTGETMILQNQTTPMKIGVLSGGRFRQLPLAAPFTQAGNTTLQW